MQSLTPRNPNTTKPKKLSSIHSPHIYWIVHGKPKSCNSLLSKWHLLSDHSVSYLGWIASMDFKAGYPPLKSLRVLLKRSIADSLRHMQHMMPSIAEMRFLHTPYCSLVIPCCSGSFVMPYMMQTWIGCGLSMTFGPL